MRFQPDFEFIHVIWFLVAVFAAWGAFILWRWWQARQEAPVVYAAKRAHGELADHVDEETFIAAYRAAEFPRRHAYIFGAGVLCFIALPPLTAVFSRAWYEIWTLAGRFEPAANGTMVYTFAMFLFCMVVMIGVLYFTLKHYYTNPPDDLRQAIRKLNGTAS